MRCARLLFDDTAATDEPESVRDVSWRWDRDFPSGMSSFMGGVLTLLASYSHGQPYTLIPGPSEILLTPAGYGVCHDWTCTMSG